MKEDRRSDLGELADAGEQVLGTDEEIAHLFEHRCWQGTWLFAGATAATLSLEMTEIGYGWVIAAALLLGWFLNEREARRLRASRR